MSKLDRLVEDYAKIPVPEGKTVAGFRVGLVLIGVAISLPVFLIGINIGQEQGLAGSAVAFCAGGVLLAIFACFTGIVGARSRLTTYMLIEYAFGVTGAKLVNLLLAGTLLGWFGVNSYLFGDATVHALADIYGLRFNLDLAIILGCALMIATTIFGFKAMDFLALLAVPLLIAIMAYVVFISLNNVSWDQMTDVRAGHMSMGMAISAIVGGYMVGVTIFPDMTRYVKGRDQAIIASIVGLAFGFPLVLMAAAVPGIATGKTDLMAIIIGFGLGAPALGVLIFSTWTTNITNLYGVGLSFSSLFGTHKSWVMVAVGGGLGTIAALVGITSELITFLIFLSIAIPPIASIYVIHFFTLFRRGHAVSEFVKMPGVRYSAMAAWATGSVVAFGAARGFWTFTSIPACDSIVASAIIYGLMLRRTAPSALAVPLRR